MVTATFNVLAYIQCMLTLGGSVVVGGRWGGGLRVGSGYWGFIV